MNEQAVKPACQVKSGDSVPLPSLRSDLVFNMGSQMLLRIVTAVTALYAARVLGPSRFGLWAMLQVLFMYTAQGHFGVVNAMMRDVPTALARGEMDEARGVTDTSWTFVSVCSVPISLCAAGVVWCCIGPMSTERMLIVIGTAWLVAVQLQSVFFQFYCRGYGKFRLLAGASVLQAMLLLPLCFYLIPRYGIAGYLFALSAGFTVITVTVMIRPDLHWGLSKTRLVRLIAVGLPMLPSSLMLYLNMSVERIALSTLGAAAVGVFVAGAFFFQTGVTIWELVIYTWYGRLARLYGQTNSIDSVIKAFREIIPGALWVTSLLQGAAYILLPITLQRLLPEYVPSIAVSQVLVVAINLWGIAQLLSFCMAIVGRQKRAAMVQSAFLVLKLLAVLVAVMYVRQVQTVALASAAAVGVYLILTYLEWKRISGHAIDSITKWAVLWTIPNGIAVACSSLLGTERSLLACVVYLLVVGGASLCLHTKSVAFRQLYAWGTAK